MELISVTFYAVVCGVLSFFAPWLGGMAPRLVVGAGVDVVAALALPFLRGFVTAY